MATRKRAGTRRPPTSSRASRGSAQARPAGGGDRAARRRAAARRGGPGGRFAWVAIALVVVIAAVFVVVKLNTHPAQASSSSRPLPASVLRQLEHVPVSTVAAEGAGSGASLPIALPASAPPLTSGSRPEVLYMGAEYCPFCAAERWALAVALSRFGTLSNLHTMESSTTDVYPGTKTLTFYGSSYASRYIVFRPVEMQTNHPAAGGGYTLLQRPTARENHLAATYDAPPYVPAQDANTIPFIDIGNRFIANGASYSPGVLTGLSWQQIAAQLADPSSAVAKGIVGTANLLTAAICETTGNQPASVCSLPVVRQAETRIRAHR